MASRLFCDVKALPIIDGWLTDVATGYRAKIGDRAKIGNGAYIGNWAKIGDGAKIGEGAQIGDRATSPVTVAYEKWTINMHSPGKVRVGCAVETYQFFYGRTPEDWRGKGYSDQQRDDALAIIRALESLDDLVWRYHRQQEAKSAEEVTA